MVEDKTIGSNRNIKKKISRGIIKQEASQKLHGKRENFI